MSNDEFAKALDEVEERCRKDPKLSAINEMRSISPSKKWQAFLDDIDARDHELRQRFVDTYRQHCEILATPETARAIESYHKGVINPLLGALLNELTSIQAELAINQMQLQDDEAASA